MDAARFLTLKHPDVIEIARLDDVGQKGVEAALRFFDAKDVILKGQSQKTKVFQTVFLSKGQNVPAQSGRALAVLCRGYLD